MLRVGNALKYKSSGLFDIKVLLNPLNLHECINIEDFYAPITRHVNWTAVQLEHENFLESFIELKKSSGEDPA